MPRKDTASSWLEAVAALLSKDRKRQPLRATRRLIAERLENRMVLSGVPEIVAEADSGESLAEYLATEKEMGPTIPAEFAATQDYDVPSAAADQFFGMEQAEGEDESGGGGQGSGSGSGGGGEGEGSGSGSGGGGGSGSGSGGPPEEPVIEEPEIEVLDGTLTVTGQVTDDDDPSELSMTLEGGEGTVTLNSDGTFTVQITDPQGNNQFTIIVTDANGNETAFTFEYNF